MNPSLETQHPGGGYVGRFAPSPTGYLHRGHILSAAIGWYRARQAGGRFLLRIEDIDHTRCREQFAEAIGEDLAWVGLDWDGPILRQSQRRDHYADALEQLKQMGLLYPCFCTRKSIESVRSTMGYKEMGPDGPIYPGICRDNTPAVNEHKMAAGRIPAWRLDVQKALSLLDRPVSWQSADGEVVQATPEIFGDVILARRDIGTSYHLAVTIDDAAQGVTEIVRGEDLREATHIHRLLQALLGLPTPIYYFHPLVRDEKKVPLAKRRLSRAIRDNRTDGMNAEDILDDLLAGPFLNRDQDRAAVSKLLAVLAEGRP